MREHNDTNCGPGMVYDTPEEKEIERLEKKLRAKDTELTRLREALAETDADYDKIQAVADRLRTELDRVTNGTALGEALAYIERLRAEVELHATQSMRWMLLAEEYSRTIARLEADARRYRYLRSLSNAEWRRFGFVPDETIDKCIDAALSAPTGGGE